MTDYHGVLVLVELQDQAVASISKELLGVGQALAGQMGQDVSALLLGHELGDAAKEAIALGADRVYAADSPGLTLYNSESYLDVMLRICRQIRPAVVLLGQTSMGRDLAPLLAAELGGSLSTDCVDLRVDPSSGRLVLTRPVYGGNALAAVESRASPQMATVRGRAMEPAQPDMSRHGDVIAVEVADIKTRVRTLEVVKTETGQVKLEEAKIVVAGGAGIGDAGDFDLVRDLAVVLGGAVGATRLPCEEGLVPWSLQIGQTGKIVAPDLYFAVAISGAPQHMAGCSGARCIVAVNRDAQANIFKAADFGIVADYRQALPVLIEKCREIKGGH